MVKLRFLIALLFFSTVALGDRAQNDNIDMQGNAIKNADIQGGTASNTSRITVPKAATATLDGLTRKEGTIVYDTTTGKLKVDNGTLLTSIGSGEGGTGVNAVTNPSAATDTTGYSDSDAGADVTRTTTAAELPLSPTVTTGIKIDPDTSAEYIAYCGQMPDALQNRKLRFSQYQKVESGYDSGDLKLEIYPSTSSTCASVGTEYALNKDSSGTTSIPSATQDFWVTFDADGSDYFQIRWVRTNASTEYLVVQNVFIGAGDQPTGPPEHGWTSYTSTVSNLTSAVATAKYRRINDTLEAYVYVDSGGSASNVIKVSIPSGLTIDTSKLATTNLNDGIIGSANAYSGSAYRYGHVEYDSTTTVRILDVTSADYWGNSIPWVWDSADSIALRFTVPIAEWSDSANVVQYGQQDVEYACNTSTSDAADTTSFSYSSSGCDLPGTLTATRAKRGRFQSPILRGDKIFIEYSSDSGATWFPYDNNNLGSIGYVIQNTTEYGMYSSPVTGTATDIDIFFTRYMTPSGATYGAAGSNWSSSSSTRKYRLKKVSGNALGGFQYATSTASGLVRNGGSPTSLTSADLTSQTNVTIDSGDVTSFKWKIVDNMVTVYFSLSTVTITGSVNNLSFTLPSSVPRPTATTYAAGLVYDNGSSITNLFASEIAMSTAGVMSISRASANFTGGTNNCYLRGQISWPVE